MVEDQKEIEKKMTRKKQKKILGFAEKNVKFTRGFVGT